MVLLALAYPYSPFYASYDDSETKFWPEIRKIFENGKQRDGMRTKLFEFWNFFLNEKERE